MQWCEAGGQEAVVINEKKSVLTIRKNFPCEDSHWNRLPREVVQFSTTEAFKTYLSRVLMNII